MSRSSKQDTIKLILAVPIHQRYLMLALCERVK